MYKYIIIILFFLFPGISTATGPDTIKTYYTGEIVVTSENEALVRTSSINEISREVIKESDNFSIDESFKGVSGLTIDKNPRNESLFKLRGYTQRQTAIFFDGVPLYLSYDGTFDLSQLSTGPAGKISISKSMSSILYGANTLGGSINIISDESSDKRNTYAKIIYGNTYGIVANTKGYYKSLYWYISANFNKSDGFTLPESYAGTINQSEGKRDNSTFIQKSIFLKTGYNFNEHADITVSFSKTLNSKDVPVNIYTKYPRYWKYTDWNNTMLNLISNVRFSENTRMRINLYTVNSYNVLNAYDDNTYSTQNKNSSFKSTYDDYSTGISLIPEIRFTDLKPAKFALQYKRDTHYDQSNYNKPNKKFSAETMTAGIEQDFNILGLDFTAAVNYNYLNIVYANDSTTRPGISEFNGHIGIGKPLSERVYIYAHLSNKSRFPTLKELFSEQLGKSLPNPSLDAERNLSTEAGAKFSNPLLGKLNAAVFYSKVYNLITAVPVSSTLTQFQNISRATLAGAELEYITSNKYFDFNINYTYLYSNNDSDTLTGYLEYRPEHTLNLRISKSYNIGFTWLIETSYTSKRFGIDTDTNIWKTMPDYALINFRVSQRLYKNFEVSFRLNNITDKYYESEYGFPQAGRIFIISIESIF